jgi:hypothetical protein
MHRSASFAAAAVCMLAGCASISESTTPVSGAPALQPTSAWVQVTRVQPAQPYQALGEIELVVSVSPAPGDDEVNRRLRAGGASLGADAVLITFDRVMPRADDVNNSQATRRKDADWKRRIVGVAIKYRE